MNKETIANRWRDIDGFDNYEVSDIGEVRNKKRGNVLKPLLKKRGTGYHYVTFYKNGRNHKRSIHRLVAFAFVDNPDDKPMVHHKNRDTMDNRVENLEWVTAQENVVHGFENGRIVWNKGNFSKRRVYSECKKYPRLMFWLLTKDDFRLSKAFWGENSCEERKITIFSDSTDRHYDGLMERIPNWQMHLQQMVLEEDPLEYLGRFL